MIMIHHICLLLLGILGWWVNPITELQDPEKNMPGNLKANCRGDNLRQSA